MRSNKLRHVSSIQKLHYIWQKMHSDLLLCFSMYGLIALLLLCCFCSWIAPYGATQVVSVPLYPPSWAENGDISYFLGTDRYGHDLFSRLLYGTQNTFGAGFLVTCCVAILGTFLGAAISFSKGIKVTLFKPLFHLFLSLPSVLIMVIIVVFVGPGQTQTMIAISISLLPIFVYSISSSINNELSKEYAIVTRLEGASHWYLLRHSIFPNILPTWINELTRISSIAILEISLLGFLGLGIQGNKPEWGIMLNNIIDFFTLNPWLLLAPGLSILGCVLLVNLFGRRLQHLLISFNNR